MPSSGGRTRPGHISLRGNFYLRTMLVQGARSTLQSALRADPTHANRLQRWIRQLHERKGYHKTPMRGNAIPCIRRYHAAA